MVDRTEEINLKDQEVYIFWRYDVYPYLLWDKAEKSRKTISLDIQYYSPNYQMWVIPHFVKEGIEAQRLTFELSELTFKRNKKLDKVVKKFNSELERIGQKYGESIIRSSTS